MGAGDLKGVVAAVAAGVGWGVGCRGSASISFPGLGEGCQTLEGWEDYARPSVPATAVLMP